MGHRGEQLAPIQLGAGVSGGVDAAAHAVNAALAADPEAMALHMDIRNAFNTVGRDAIFAAVKRESPQLLPFVTWAYGAATNLVVLGADVEPLQSATGVRQGDPLSTYLFSIVFQPVLEAATQVLPTVAFVDDATLVGRADALRQAFPAFVAGCKSDGRNLEAAPQKCAITGGNPHAAAALAAELGVQHAPDGIVCYGTPIGSEEFVSSTIEKRADVIVAEVERLMQLPLDSQTQWSLLRGSLSKRLDHLKRTVPWQRLAATVRRVEAAIQKAAAAIFELPPDPDGVAACRPDLLEQLTLPLRHGGFGLHAMCETEADAALLSGAAIGQNVMAEGPVACRPLEPDSAMRAQLLPRWQRVHEQCHEQCGWIEEAINLPPEFIKHMLPSAAHDVSRAATDARGKAMLDACDTAVQSGQQKAARLRSASGAAAGAWLEALPCVPATRMNSDEFKSAGRHRLGLGLASGVRTPACTCRRGLASEADHAMVCDHARGEGTLRHDLLTSVWRCLLRKAGLPTSTEPRLGRLANAAQDIQRAGMRRADISTVIGTAVTLTDTVVIHPAAASYCARAAAVGGAAAKVAENDKLREFRNHGDNGGAVLVPLATETYGRHGRHAMRFLSQLGDIVSGKGGSKREFVRCARSELSVALVRGNARMYNRTLFNVVRASGDAFLHGYECVVSGHAYD